MPFRDRSSGRHRSVRWTDFTVRRDADSRMVRLWHNVTYSEAIAGGVEQHDESQQRDALAQKGDSHDRAAFTWKR